MTWLFLKSSRFFVGFLPLESDLLPYGLIRQFYYAAISRISPKLKEWMQFASALKPQFYLKRILSMIEKKYIRTKLFHQSNFQSHRWRICYGCMRKAAITDEPIVVMLKIQYDRFDNIIVRKAWCTYYVSRRNCWPY